MRKWTNALIGVLLIPISLTMAYTFCRLMWDLPWLKLPLLPFALGFLVYGVVHAIFYKPVFMHVMGHELTHALWAFFFGGNVKSLQITPQGGKVIVNRSNFLIILAPYFFPLYTCLLLPVYAVAKESFAPYVVFLLGASIAFHLILTAYSLWLNQSDVQAVGFLLSLNIILIINLLILTLLVSYIAPAAYPYGQFWISLWQDLGQGFWWCVNMFKGART